MYAKLFPIGASLAFLVAMAMVPPAHAAGPVNSANPACGKVVQSGGEGGNSKYADQGGGGGEGGNPKYTPKYANGGGGEGGNPKYANGGGGGGEGGNPKYAGAPCQ